MANPQTILGTRVPVDFMVDRNDTGNGGIVTIQSYTNITTNTGAILIPLAGGVFADDWKSEGSFSGSGMTN